MKTPSPSEALRSEFHEKQSRLNTWLDRHQLDGVMLWLRSHFAWSSCGADNHVANNNAVGAAGMLATRALRVCFADQIEAPRLRDEAMAARGVEVIDFPWHERDEARRLAREIIGDRRIAADVDVLGLGVPPLPRGFDELHWTLTSNEQARYRDGCRRAARAMESACRALKPGLSEHEIAGILDHEIRRAGCNPIVTLVASDERATKFRHPLPTDHVLRQYVMLVTCAEFGGLIANLTRCVHFGPIPHDLRKRQQAAANIDATVILATKPSRTLGEIFEILARAYQAEEFPDEWRLHHQGGSTGYSPRDAIATPENPLTVRASQAFAWNPSISGAKSEDTIFVTDDAVQVLTAHSPEWPTIVGKGQFGDLSRADVLVVQ